MSGGLTSQQVSGISMESAPPERGKLRQKAGTKKEEKKWGRGVRADTSRRSGTHVYVCGYFGDSEMARKVAGKVREKATLLPRTAPCFMQEFLKDGQKPARTLFISDHS